VSEARAMVHQSQKMLDTPLKKKGVERSTSDASSVSPRSPASPGDASPVDTGEEDVETLQPRTLHGKLLSWSIGLEGGDVASVALPDFKERVWDDVRDYYEYMKVSAGVIQKEWKRYRAQSRYERYKKGRKAHDLGVQEEFYSLWARVHLQRPNVRIVCSQFMIGWRVYVRECQIAEDKAQDLANLWNVVVIKRNLKEWSWICSIERHARCLYYRRHWLDVLEWTRFQLAWKRMRRRLQGKFLYHAYRALYFYARCSAKTKARAFRLFRYFDESVAELGMPLARFPGYHQLFYCDDVLERFREKDAVERKIMRLSYTRLMPKVVDRWSTYVDSCKKTRYSIQHSIKRIQRRGLLQLKANADEMAEQRERDADRVRTITGFDEASRAAGAADDGPSNEMDNLAELVDHEEREQLRQMVKEEKRKLIIRMRFEQLRKESEVLRLLPAKFDESMRLLDRELNERDKRWQAKLNDERKLIRDEAKADLTTWNKTVDSYRKVLSDATDILTGVMDRAEADHSADVFYGCWCHLRKAAAHVRLRRVVHRNYLQRLLGVCSRHRRMEKSVHRYYRLRIKWVWWLRWLRMIEHHYKETTPGLKVSILRRRALALRVSDTLAPIGRLLTLPEACKRLDVTFYLWLERVHTVFSRREVTHLWRMRRAVRVVHRCFDFLKNRIIWSGRAKAIAAGEKPWVERNASADLYIWKRKFFSGVAYAEMLRQIEEKLKKKFMSMVKGGVRLPQLISDRRAEVEKKCVLEQKLLLKTLDEIDSSSSSGAASVFAGSFPVKHWGTVLNLRRNEVLCQLDRADALARRARRDFDSARVAFYLSDWMFRASTVGLPVLGDKTLTNDKKYWIEVKNLFQMARSGQVTMKTRD